MRKIIRHAISYPAMALGGALLWGIVEFVALQRARRKVARERVRWPRPR